MSASVTANAGSLLVMAAAFFNGDCDTSESGGRGGIIDCGFLHGIIFGAGGIGSCVASLLRSSETWDVLSASLYTMTGFDLVVCLSSVLGDAGPVRACFVPSCVIITSSESPVSVLWFCVVVAFSTSLGLPALV